MISDPRLFNWILLGLYCCAAVRWAYAQEWWQATYFVGAILIVCALTFGGPR